jgi:xylulokinase
MRELLLGVDVGTQATKGVLCTPNGEIVASASVAHPTASPRAGWYEQDAEACWWGDFCRVTHDLLARDGVRAANVVGVGCSSMTPNMLPLDRAGIPLRPAMLYCDSRSTEIYPAILQKVSADEILRLGGFRLAAHGGWQGGQLLWMRRYQATLYRRTCKVVGTTNYLVYRLTGAFVADYALARCNVPFYDQRRRAWNEEMCALLDVPARLFPGCIGYSTEIAGHVTACAARECGLAEGTPVTFGAMDTNADMLAAGVTEPGDVGLAYGTTLIGSKCLPEPYAGPCGFSNDYVVPQRYLCGSGVATAGAIVLWFRDVFGREEVEAEAQGGPDAFAALSALATSVPPGSEGLIVVPLFSGDKRTDLSPDSLPGERLAPGAVLGLSTFHGRAHLYRAILEGTAYETRRQLEQIAPWIPLSRLRSVGGGTRNRVWTQIVSDVLQVEQRCFPDTFGAPYGDAYLAGLGVGLFSDFEPLSKSWIRGGYVVVPSPKAREPYERMYSLYLDVIRSVWRIPNCF